MPYCPRCGAEYEEGFTACHECRVELVAERPAISPGPVGLPYGLRVVLSQFALGWHYAVEAARLLRRHPGLLVLPLLVVVFNGVENNLGIYLMIRHTATGRQMAAIVPQGAESRGYRAMRELAPGQIAYDAARTTLREFPTPVPAPELRGTLGLISTAMLPNQSAGLGVLFAILVSALESLVFMVPLSALFLSGYYPRLRATAEGAPSEAPRLRQAVRENWWRFVAYLALLTTVSVALYEAFAYLSGPLLSYGLNVIGAPPPLSMTFIFVREWLARVLVLLLGLGLVALAYDRMRVLDAVRRSILTVVRQLPITVVLLGLPFLALVLILIVRVGVAAFLPYPPASPYFALPSVGGIALQLGTNALLALLGVWLALAQFLWYREANPVPVAAPEPNGAMPAEG